MYTDDYNDRLAGDSYYSNYSTGENYTPKINPSEVLAPLIRQLKTYDIARLKLEKKGGKISDLKAISDILTTNIKLTTDYESHEIALTNQQKLKQIIRGIDWNLHFETRLLPSKMPVYYLCRTHRNYFQYYDLIVEDIYLSPHYPLGDDRFTRLMTGGKEKYFLRLAQFRKALQSKDLKYLPSKLNSSLEGRIDRLLVLLGSHIFQTAWHHHQIPVFRLAQCFNLQKISQAVELQYFILSLPGQISEIRSIMNQQILEFFKKIYPQPSIFKLLNNFEGLNEDDINRLAKKAIVSYQQLSKALWAFLNVQVPWGNRKIDVQFYKIFLANFSRLNLIAPALEQNHDFSLAKLKIEKSAKNVIDRLS